MIAARQDTGKIAIYYHGTFTNNVEFILREGLRPQGSFPSHDEYLDSPSLPEFIYLTTSLGMAVDYIVRVSERVHKGAPVTILTVITQHWTPSAFTRMKIGSRPSGTGTSPTGPM